MVNFFLAAIMRMPSTAKSRTRMMAKTQIGTIFKYVRARKARLVSILSAMGSRKAPRSVTSFFLRAHLPSIKSVIEAMIKMTKAVILAQVPGRSTKNKNRIERNILIIVSIVGPVIRYISCAQLSRRERRQSALRAHR